MALADEMEVRFQQFSKDQVPIDETELPITTLVRLVQPLKAEFRIEVTILGIV